ncbi:hypothetical protein LXA43DRAFT_1188306 [Ganoderma leucocontextum]|nr:hypothetical protein LXA43DRAFT_1188306 [Ganoderma leucocontextum]
MGVEGWVAECLTLFAARQERTLASRTIFGWVVARGWFTLQNQLQRSRDNFQYGDLFDLMENWSPTIYDAVPWRTIPMPHVSKVYLKHGLSVCRDGGHTTFSLDGGTASILINTLCKILKDVWQTVEADPVDFCHFSTAIQVFTHTSLTQMLAPNWCRDRTENVAQAVDDGWDPLTRADCHDFDSDYALRYVRKLTSSATAVLNVSLPDTLPLLATANVTVVSVLEPPHARPDRDSARDRVTQPLLDEIRRRLTSESESEVCEEALKWVRDTAAGASDESSCYIDAEAGAMALACDARTRPEVDSEHALEYGIVSVRCRCVRNARRD